MPRYAEVALQLAFGAGKVERKAGLNGLDGIGKGIVVIIIIIILFAQQYNSMHIYINTVERSRTARSDKNTNSCPKTFSKTVTGYIFYHTHTHPSV